MIQEGGWPLKVGTDLKLAGRKVEIFDGKPHVMETAIKGDVALIKAWKGDKAGNLVYRGTANNFNGAMAAAGKHTIPRWRSWWKSERSLRSRSTRRGYTS